MIQLLLNLKGIILTVMAKHVALLIYLFIIGLPMSAGAQTWLTDRENIEAQGIRVGDSLIFHPGAVIEGGYNTNPIRHAENPDGAGRLRLGSYLDLATRKEERRVEDEGVQDATPPKIDFRFGLAGYYDFYFSKVAAIRNQDDFGIDTHVNFALFPSGPYTLLLRGIYLRTLEPYESSEEMHARDMIKPGIGFKATPGGGTLMLSLFYDADILLYEDSVIGASRNKVAHEVAFDIQWKMLPKTAIVSKVLFSPILYLGSDDLNNNSLPVRGLIGIRGLMTNRFGMSLFVGYGASFYSQGDDFDGVIANGELMFFITPTAQIRIGGQRDFVDSFYANFYVKNGGYLKYEQMFANVFLLSLKVEAFYRDYSTLSGSYRGEAITDTSRTETWLGTTLSLEYRTTAWLSIIASAIYKGNISDFTYSTGYKVSFHEFDGLIGLRVHY